MSARTPRKSTQAPVSTVLLAALRKSKPRQQARSPVLFVAWICASITSVAWVGSFFDDALGSPVFNGAISLGLWATVAFANLAEALAEGRGKAQASALRRSRTELVAKKVRSPARDYTSVLASDVRRGESILVEAGDLIACDGEVIEGAATVDESVITGESAPVIREPGELRGSVTAGTRVLSDWIVVRVTAQSGESVLDRMIALVEGAKRTKTPNELALHVLLVALTLIFLVVSVSLYAFGEYASVVQQRPGVSIVVLVALMVCLIPTTIGGLLSAIGIAGMDRMLQANVLATSGHAVETAGDVDVLLLDKTGTITFGNRRATHLVTAPGVAMQQLATSAWLASQGDETPEGKSIVELAATLDAAPTAMNGGTAVAFSAHTRMSGVDLPTLQIRKGATDAVRAWVQAFGHDVPEVVEEGVQVIARTGGTPLLVADDHRGVLGIVHLEDVLKPAVKERFVELRRMGIRTVMVTGDNPLTAAAIAAEAGVDDFLAEAKPEIKLDYIRSYQAKGHLVAMTGDGSNDAPALAQANVALAMNSGTQAAKEAANLVDLDSDPTKLIEVVRIGKQLLMTRGALTTFSLANDVAKYFAIIPAAFATTYPELDAWNLMRLDSPQSAILSAVVFNAVVIVALVPLALRGVRQRSLGAAQLLARNLAVFGVGGLIVPFVAIKLIDMAVAPLMR